MADAPPPPRDPGMWPIRLAAIGALLAWFAMLWFMFGDVM